MNLGFRTALVAASIWLASVSQSASAAPALQKFQQEVSQQFTGALSPRSCQLIELDNSSEPRVFADGRWWQLRDHRWTAMPNLDPSSAGEFVVPMEGAAPWRVAVPWAHVRQIVRLQNQVWIATSNSLFEIVTGQPKSLDWPTDKQISQIAVAPGPILWAASNDRLYQYADAAWSKVLAIDAFGRDWTGKGILGVTRDSNNQWWIATRAGIGCRTKDGWRFFEGKDGLPWNEFTSMAAGPNGQVWMGTTLGSIELNGSDWHYRQGPRWWPADEIRQLVVDSRNQAWAITSSGIGAILRPSMTLAEKAAYYELEIEKYIKRTTFGYTAEAPLSKPAAKSTARPVDSDNDGLWTAMYGAGECFAVAATGDTTARARAKKAFEALRFLQKVTQGGPNSARSGFVARTIRPIDWPDPNIGSKESDLRTQKHDALWKSYQPRWPKSVDGQWYWKSDTSSDELDGHYFFYPLYHEFCADTPQEKARVQEVVRDLTDHLIAHDFTLTDHDGKPTRWGIFGPQSLNGDPMWWSERGLNSLSILCYLAVTEAVTGDAKYGKISRQLIETHGYGHNLMYPKVQHGPGSGNQSDDEMAIMCYYGLLRYSKDEDLKTLVRYSFYRYWANEFPEQNPFFNFAYAAHNTGQTAKNPFGTFELTPWPGWHEDALATLRGFPLDRLNWSHRNSHRLDLVRQTRQAGMDLYEPDSRPRGLRVNGKVIPVENRHFNHWNTDPWTLDYGGNGDELASGTVYLLPYYMGLYHGYIEKP